MLSPTTAIAAPINLHIFPSFSYVVCLMLLTLKCTSLHKHNDVATLFMQDSYVRSPSNLSIVMSHFCVFVLAILDMSMIFPILVLPINF